MPAEEKKSGSKCSNCKDCKSRGLKKSGYKRIMQQVILFKLGLMDKFIAKHKGKMSDADLLKLMNKVTPRYDASNQDYGFLKDIPREQLRKRFKHLHDFSCNWKIQHTPVAMFDKWSRSPEPTHHGDG